MNNIWGLEANYKGINLSQQMMEPGLELWSQILNYSTHYSFCSYILKAKFSLSYFERNHSDFYSW